MPFDFNFDDFDFFDFEKDPGVPEEYKKKKKESSWLEDFMSFGSAESDMYVRPEPLPNPKPTAEERVPKLSAAEPETIWQKVAGTIDDFVNPRLEGTMAPSDIADAQIKMEARKNIVKDKNDEGKTIFRPQYKEEFMDEVDPDNSGVRKATQLFKDVGVGALSTAEGIAGGAEWLTNGIIGNDLANQAKLWGQDLSAEEQGFSNQLAQGIGSMGTFFIPGIGVMKGATALAKVSPNLAKWMGAGTMTAMEAMTEAGSVYRDVLHETKDPARATLAATEAFTLNIPLLTITNKLGMFGESGTAIKRALVSSLMEGGQEAGQEIISTTSAGKPVKWGDVLTSGAIGAIIGGGTGALAHGAMDDDQKTDVDKATTSLGVPDNGTDSSFLVKRLIENGSIDDVKYALAPENAKLWAPEERAHLEQHYSRLLATESPTAKLDKTVDDHLQGKTTSADLLDTFAGEFDNMEDLLREEPADVNARKIRYGDKQPELDLGTSSMPLFDATNLSSPSEIVDSRANGEAVYSPTISNTSTINFADMVKEAARWKGAAINVDEALGEDKKARLAHSRITTKGDLDAYLMKKYGIDATVARSVSNELTDKNIPADRSAKAEDFADEPWAKTQGQDDLDTEASKYKTAKEFATAKVNAYHGTSSEEFDQFGGDVAYFTREKGEAVAFSENPIIGGGRGVGTPRVLEVALPEGKTKNIDDGVQEVVMEEHPDFDNLEEYIAHEAKIAREEGFDYLTFNHPSSVHGGEFEAIVAVNPKKVKTRKQLEEIHKAAAKKTSADLDVSKIVTEEYRPYSQKNPGEGGNYEWKRVDRSQIGKTIKQGPEADYEDYTIDENAAYGQVEVTEFRPHEIEARKKRGIDINEKTKTAITNSFELAPDLRGKGLGRKLWQKIEDDARKHGAERMEIWHVMSDATGFWRKMGFKPIAGGSEDARTWVKEKEDFLPKVNEPQEKKGKKTSVESPRGEYGDDEKVTRLVTKPLREAHKKLQEEIKDRLREKMERVAAYDGWKWEIGDRVKSKKTGKVWEVTAKSWNDHKNVPTYYMRTRGVKDGEESGMFYAEPSHDAFIHLNGQISSVKEADAEYGAPKKADTFYSQMAQVLDKKLPNQGTPAQFRTMINAWAQKGEFKAEELKWSGVDEWLAGKKEKVTRKDVVDFIHENQIQIQEITKGETVNPIYRIVDWNQQVIESGFETRQEAEERRDALEIEQDAELYVESEQGEDELTGTLPPGDHSGETKYSNYQLPGGENYRELLLTLPERSTRTELDAEARKIAKRDGLDYDSLSEGEQRGYRRTAITEHGSDHDAKVNYHSSHWSEPNVLLHVRMNDRVDADGKRVLFLEEVQSDWHQEGRRRGYGQKEKYAVFSNARAIGEYSSREEAEAALEDAGGSGEIQDLTRPGVPLAPFSKTWHELGMKRMLRYAAENGYDRLAWTTGEQQAERYDLSKQLDAIEYSQHPIGYWLRATDKNDHGVLAQSYREEELPNVVGKELAEKIVSGVGVEVRPGKWGGVEKRLSGLDLKVGGEGMKGFYDKILPSFMNKYVKKWGAKVEEMAIPREESKSWKTIDTTTPEGIKQLESWGKTTVHSIDITDAMREDILTKGQALYEPDSTYAARAIKALSKAADFFTAKGLLPGAGLLNRGEQGAYRDTTGVRGEKTRHHTVGKLVGDLKDLKVARLRGIEAKTWNDVYEALRITRNKNVEILQVLYIGEKSGKILYNEACSSRLPGAVQIGSPAILSSAIHATTLTMRRVAKEEVKVVIAHNHPSGDVTASAADKKMTTALAEYLKIKRVPFDGHIIINHNRYNVIDGEGTTDQRALRDVGEEKDPLVTTPVPHEKLGKTLTRQDHVAAIAKDINRGRKYFTLLMRSGTRIRGIVNIELGVLDDPKKAHAYIKDLMVNHGAQDAFAYREDFTQGQINTLVDLVQGNTLRDAAWETESRTATLTEQGIFGNTNKQFGRDLSDFQGKWFEGYSSEFQEERGEYGTETGLKEENSSYTNAREFGSVSPMTSRKGTGDIPPKKTPRPVGGNWEKTSNDLWSGAYQGKYVSVKVMGNDGPYFVSSPEGISRQFDSLNDAQRMAESAIDQALAMPHDRFTLTESFKRRFGDWEGKINRGEYHLSYNGTETAVSKVTDDYYRPLLVYRGDISNSTKSVNNPRAGGEIDGIFFTNKKGEAEWYARGGHFQQGKVGMGKVTTAYLDIKKPYYVADTNYLVQNNVSTSELMSRGYDGVIIGNGKDGHKWYVVFDKKQIINNPPNPSRPPEVGGRVSKPTLVKDKDAPYGEDLDEPPFGDEDDSFDFGNNVEKAIDKNPEEYISIDFIDHLDGYIGTLRSLVIEGEPGKRTTDKDTGEAIWWSSTYPEFMQDQGWSQKEVLSALSHSIKGEEMTEKQREIVQTAINQAVEMFYEDLNRWYPNMTGKQYDKAEASIRKATDAFLSRYYTNQKLLKQEKEKADRATMITKSKYQWEKEKRQAENKAWEKGAKAVHAVQDQIIEKLQTKLDTAVKIRDQYRDRALKMLSEGKQKNLDMEARENATLNEIKKLNSKVEKLKASIEKIKTAKPKEAKKSIKAIIRISTGQNLDDKAWISKYKLLTEQIRREAMAARKAFSAGNREGLLAARTKYKMLQAQQRAMREIKRNTNKIIKDFKKVLKQTSEMTPEYANKIKSLLEDFDLSRMTGETRLKLEAIREALIENPDADIDERTLDTLKRLEKTPVRDISYPELKAMHDAVMHFATLGKRGPTMIMSQKAVMRDMVLKRSFKDMRPAKEVSKDLIPDATYSRMKSVRAQLAALRDQYGVHLDTYDNIVESLGGMQSMMYRVLYREIKRGSNERDRIAYELEDDFMAAQEAWQKRHPEIKDVLGWLSEEVEFAGIRMNRNLAISLYRGWFDPDFQRSIIESGFGLWGSQDRDNPNKIFKVSGERYGDAVNKLSKAEREYADLAIPTINKSGDLLADKFLEINGYAMPRVEDIYWRKEVLASEREQDEQQEQLKERFGRPHIFKGMTKKRTGSSAAVWLKPYTVAVREMHKRAADYVGLEEAMNNAAWLMYNKEFKSEIEARYGLPVWREIEKGLKDIAEVTTPELSGNAAKFFRWLRNKSTVYALAANYGSMLKQLNGTINYMVYVDPGYIARAVRVYASNPMAVKRLHRQMSVEYRRRREMGYSQDIGNVLQVLNKQGLKPSAASKMGAVGLIPLQQFDIFGVDLGMLGATYQAMDAFKAGKMPDQMRMALDITDAQVTKLTPAQKMELAYRWADFVTQRTQNQNVPEHMSGWQRGGELEKQLSMFFGEMQKNIAGFARAYRAVKRGDPGAKALLLKSVLIFAIIGMAVDAGVNELKNQLRGRRGDKWWAAVLKSYAGYLPGIRDVAGVVIDQIQGRYYSSGGDTPYERVRAALEKPLGAGIGAINANTPRKQRDQIMKFTDGLANFFSMLAGIPYHALKEPIRIWNREDELRKTRAEERRRRAI